jgi:hypothetical protein
VGGYKLMAITTEAHLIAARAGSRPIQIVKQSVTSVSGTKSSLYRLLGGFPAQPPIPTAAVVCNAATEGALAPPFAVLPGNELYVDAISMQLGAVAQIEIVDRVIHSGGLNATLTTPQAINTPALPPRASAAQCRWYCEFYLDGGGTAANATFNVTHTDSTTSAIVVSIVASVRSARKIELVPAAGKIISSVQQVTLSASTGTASNFGVVAEQFSGVKAGVLAANGTIEYEGLVRRVGSADACLSANLNCTGISTGAVEGSIQLMQG